jgi:hypothetical protein
MPHPQFQQQFAMNLDHFVDFAAGIVLMRVQHTQPQLPPVIYPDPFVLCCVGCFWCGGCDGWLLQLLLLLLQCYTGEGLEGWNKQMLKLRLPSRW